MVLKHKFRVEQFSVWFRVHTAGEYQLKFKTETTDSERLNSEWGTENYGP